MKQEPVTTQIARYCTSVRYDALEKEVVEKAKQLILDQLGVEIACAQLPWNQDLARYVKDIGAPGKCAVIGFPIKTNIEFALLANATFGQGFEIDDYIHTSHLGHAGAVTVPVACALAQTMPVSGKKMIEAVVIGFDIMSAVGRSIQPTSMYGRGFHQQSASGPFASAAVAGVILGEDVPTLRDAFSLAASHACGIAEYTNTGGNVKRLHSGMAAMGGVRSAVLAGYGWNGPPTAIEGKRGFCQAFAPEPHIEAIAETLKEHWVMHAGIKRHCCNGQVIPPIDCMRAIIAETPLKPEQVTDIEVRFTTKSLKQVGSIGPEPQDRVGAQFSMHFSVALALVKGSNDFNTLMTVDLKDPQVVGVAKKLRIVVDPRAEEEDNKGNNWAQVIVTTTDGRKLSKDAYAKGSPEVPLTQEEIEEKFRQLTLPLLDEKRVKELIGLCRNLEKVDDASKLVKAIGKLDVSGKKITGVS